MPGKHLSTFDALTPEEYARIVKQNTELHRRCQKAESAVRKFKAEWEEHGGPRGGSMGRALIESAAGLLKQENDRLNGLLSLDLMKPIEPRRAAVWIEVLEWLDSSGFTLRCHGPLCTWQVVDPAFTGQAAIQGEGDSPRDALIQAYTQDPGGAEFEYLEEEA